MCVCVCLCVCETSKAKLGPTGGSYLIPNLSSEVRKNFLNIRGIGK